MRTERVQMYKCRKEESEMKRRKKKTQTKQTKVCVRHTSNLHSFGVEAHGGDKSRVEFESEQRLRQSAQILLQGTRQDLHVGGLPLQRLHRVRRQPLTTEEVLVDQSEIGRLAYCFVCHGCEKNE